jgi:capsular exopolysaccharide synthesis family protein
MSRIYDALKRSSDSRTASISESIDAIQSEVEAGVLAPTRSMSPVAASVLESHFDTTAPTSQYGTTHVSLPLPGPVFPFSGSNAQASEQYRILRTNLVQHPAQPRVIAISSATPGDGKSTTTVNLAGTFALKSEANVLIIDADLRRCGIAEALKLEAKHGLCDVLRGQCALEDAIIRMDQMPNLHILPSRRSPVNPAELLDSEAWKALIHALRGQFSYILIDTTPVQAVADFKLVQQVVDGVVMVVRPDHTNRAALTRALEVQNDNKLLGIVVNAYEDWFLWDTGRGYGYYAA